MAQPKLVCPECGMATLNNQYMLDRHMKARHTNHSVDVVSEPGVLGPDEQVLKFNIPVEFQINGKRYSGTEIAVEYDRVSAALDIVRNAYGAEAIAL